MITRQVGPALAAGCPSLVKPSELTPLSAMALMEMGRKAGIPDAAFDVLPLGADHTPLFGREICTNDDVKKISFTGSTRVGKILQRQVRCVCANSTAFARS